METQNILYNHSHEIPEGLYLQLMNSLKNDFYNHKNKQIKYIIIDTDIELINNLYLNLKRLQKFSNIILIISTNLFIYCFYKIFIIINK